MTRILGSVPLSAMPCPSDADPGAHDEDDESEEFSLLEEVRAAIDFLQYAEAELTRKYPRLGIVDEHITDALAALGAQEAR